MKFFPLIIQAEDMLAGGLGFSGSNPVIQVAGAQRIIDTAPELLFASGNYSAVPALFGANKQEGTLVLGCKLKVLLLCTVFQI